MGRRPAVHRAPTLLAAALLLALIPCARADGPAPVRLDRLVPARTRAFASLDGLGRPLARLWEATALGRMLADPEMAAVVDPALEGLARALDEAALALDGPGFLAPAAADALRQVGKLEGQAALALVRPEGPERRDWMLCLDFGPRLREFLAFLSRLPFPGSGVGLPVRAAARPDGPTWTLGAEGSPVALHVATVGTAILASTDARWVEDRVRTGAAAVDDALEGAPAYVGVRARLGRDGPGLFAYLGPGGLEDVLSLLPVPNPTPLSEELGLGAGAPAAGYRASFDGDGFLQDLVLGACDPGAGSAGALGRSPTSHALLRLAPRATLFASEQSVEATAFVPRARAILDLADPDGTLGVERLLEGSADLLDRETGQALLAGLSDESLLWVGLPPTGGVFPEAGLAVTLKDPAAFEAALGAAVDSICERVALGGEVRASARTIPFHGTRLHVVDLQGTRPGDLVPWTPTWAVLGGHLVVTAVPHALKEIVLRAEAGDAGLSGEADVRALLAEGPADAGTFAYFNGRALLAAVYDTGAPWLQSFGRAAVAGLPFPLDVARLPPTRTVLPYLRSTGAFLSRDGQGLRWTVRGPLPVLPAAVAAALASGWFGAARTQSATPDAGSADQPGTSVAVPDPQEETRRTLGRVAAALEEFAALHGALPTSLDELVAKAHLLGGLPTDRWGRPLRWTRDADGRRGTLSSAGADGVPGSDDDLIVEVEPAAK